MKYKLFLDDYRVPTDCINYMHNRIGTWNKIYTEEWVVVKDYPSFCRFIKDNGLPDIISFDHDLAEEHYGLEIFDSQELNDFYLTDHIETGYDCAKWLIEYCQNNNLKMCDYIVYSMNPMGSQNIISLIENYKKYEN